MTAQTAMRLGVFYDGGWFNKLWDYYRRHSTWKASPSFPGIHDLIRWRLHHSTGFPLPQITLTQTHLVWARASNNDPQVQGRGTAPGELFVRGQRVGHSSLWDDVLTRSGIRRHNALITPKGEKGADVLLALLTYETAITAPLDAVALITGDADLVPLVQRLSDRGIHVIVPAIYADRERVTTSSDLAKAADDAPLWDDLLTEAMKPDYPLSYPFNDGAKATPGNPVDSDGYRRGTINRWLKRHGFLTDTTGQKWFVPQQELPAGTDSLPVGTHVKFVGRPNPQPGRQHPDARKIRPYEPDGIL